MTLSSKVRSNYLVLMVGALAAVGASPACSSDATSPTPGAGGASAGRPGSGGAAVAGAPGAGSPSAGGAGNVAGANPGVGGAAVGGSIGDTGGAPPSAGAAGAIGCTSQQYTHVSAFPVGSVTTDGWGVTNNSAGEFLHTVDPTTNMVVQEGATVSIDATVGSPDSASVKLGVPFSMPGQKLDFGQNFTGKNLAGTVVSAMVKLDSGLVGTPTSVAQALMILKTGAGYIYVEGESVILDPAGGWVTIKIDADMPTTDLPPGYNACEVREIDVEIRSAATGTFTPAVIHIDTIAITAKHPGGGEAGAGGTGGDAGAAGAN